MPRLLLSPSATTIAALLLPCVTDLSICIVDDAALAHGLGLRPDTVYRALAELDSAGAVEMGRATGSVRSLIFRADSWVWTAVAQISAAEAVTR